MTSNYNRKVEYLIYWLGAGDELDLSRINRLLENGIPVEGFVTEESIREAIENKIPDLLVVANFSDVQTSLNVGLGLKSGQSFSLLMICELLNKEEKEYFYQSGGNELILEPASLIEIFFRIANLKFIFDKSNNAEIQIEEASQMALLAMENSSDLGSTISFVKAAAKCRDYPSLASSILDAVRVYSDSAILELTGAEKNYYFGSGGQIDPDLKKILLSNKSQQNRIVRFDNAFQMNHENLTLLAEGLPVEDSARMGRIADNLVILTDTADRFVSELLLQEKSIVIEKAKQRFISTISHELNTPMNAIQGFSKMFANRNEDECFGEKGIKALNSIYENSTKIKSIIETLIEITSDAHLSDNSENENIEFEPLLQHLKNQCLSKANDKQLKLIFPDNINIQMCSNERHLKKMLFHLLDNAIKFTDQGDVELSIQLIVSPSHETLVEFSVRDTGIGISENNIERLFTQLGQLDVSHDRSQYGAGLGLYYVQSFAKQLNGNVSVQSIENEGSNFILTLPSNLSTHSNDAELF